MGVPIAAGTKTRRPAVRASMGSGVVHFTLPAEDDQERIRAWALDLEQAVRQVGGWVGLDAPAGMATRILPRRWPDRISAAIKAHFDPSDVLPPVP